MSPEDQQTRIDNYLLGIGTPEEWREFEEEAARDPSLSQRLADTRLAMDAVEVLEDEQLKQRLRGLETDILGEDTGSATATLSTSPRRAVQEKGGAKVVTMQPLKRSRRTLLAYAASLLLLLAAGWWIVQLNGSSTPGELAMDNFDPHPNITPGPERGGGDDATEAAAYRAYDEGNYVQAATLFASLPATNAHSFYRGQSLLAQQKYREATGVFLPLSQLSVDEFSLKGESAYALAISQLGTGDVEAARKSLRLAAAVPGNRLADQARSLLEQL